MAETSTTTDTNREVSPETQQKIRAAISNAFYDARNDGRTMESAADAAVRALLPIVQSIDANAHGRGATHLADSFRREADASATGIWRDAVTLVDQLAKNEVSA